MSSTRARKDVIQGLTAKGFRQETGRDHLFLMFEHPRKTTAVYTKVSHAGKDIGAPLISRMAKQCKLSKADFLDLVDCPLDLAGYVAKLQQGGFISPAPENHAGPEG